MDIPSKRRRLMASFIDCVALISMVVLLFQATDDITILILLMGLLDFIYSVYCVYRFDGTLGKKIMGMAIEHLDGSSVQLWTAVKRHYGVAVLGFAASVPVAAIAMLLDASLLSGGLMMIATGIGNLLAWADPLAIFFNEQRRALHDYVANTVVVND